MRTIRASLAARSHAHRRPHTLGLADAAPLTFCKVASCSKERAWPGWGGLYCPHGRPSLPANLRPGTSQSHDDMLHQKVSMRAPKAKAATNQISHKIATVAASVSLLLAQPALADLRESGTSWSSQHAFS